MRFGTYCVSKDVFRLSFALFLDENEKYDDFRIAEDCVLSYDNSIVGTILDAIHTSKDHALVLRFELNKTLRDIDVIQDCVFTYNDEGIITVASLIKG